LIGGGYDKGETFDAFFDHCRNHQVHAVVLMGDTADCMRESAEKAGIEQIAHARNMEEAVQTAMSLSHEGDWILLSPACASWDQYKNYEERGEIFRQVVMQIEEGN
jgi:UDP-N-acetylmuramoylalanine--D-glutamate ligase